MTKKKTKFKPVEATGNVEAHQSGWRARIWQNQKNQRGPSRLHYEDALNDLLMVRSGVPIDRLYESLKPTTAHLERQGNSFRVRFFYGQENWRTPSRSTQAEAMRDLEQFGINKDTGLTRASNRAASGRQRQRRVTNPPAEA